ncbi:MAG: sulfur carrier protein ThiS [Gammaproteobacteria bacterium]|nr:sulfur carrier protein ThiS [Gammaproteobacteria bacterium]
MTESHLILNGKHHPYPGDDLMLLLAEFDVAPDARGVAVAVNGEVVPRRDWPKTPLSPGDEVDIVGAVQGG